MGKPTINSINKDPPPLEKTLKHTISKSTRETIKNILKCLDPRVNALEDINDLACKYRGKFNLSLKLTKEPNKLDPFLNFKLCRWETELNRICVLDPVIAVENFVDNEGPPKDFQYVRENITSFLDEDLTDPGFLIGCECYPRCSSSNCSCPKLAGGQFAYDRNKRVLLPIGSPIFECNKTCKCSSNCPNRVIQKGLTTRVCIFRTADGRGWGLKTREFIPKNKFVVEYVGEIITSEEAERRGTVYDTKEQTYLFDLDFNGADNAFTVDAYRYGNVSHFINHSCEPNLQVYSVWVDSLDARLPRIALFAVRDIHIGEELTFDYLMTLKCSENQKVRKNKKKKDNVNLSNRVYCACGSSQCRKFLF